MSLKDLSWKKIVGQEAIQQGTWSVQTSDGQHHTVWAGISTSLASHLLEVKVDGRSLQKSRVWVNLGQLAQFELGGDMLEIRQGGWGVIGALKLLQNGREVKTSELRTHDDRSPSVQDRDQTTSSKPWRTWIEEAERVSEPLGVEERVIDNSRSKSTIERRIVVSRQWTQRIALARDNSTTFNGGARVSLPLSLSLEASANQTIKRAYSVSDESTRTYSEEVKISVASETRTKVTFRWRQVWQKGIIVGQQDGDPTEVRVPFEVKLHPTFDQLQEDIET